MASLTGDQTYLWRKNSSSKYPWDRKFLNIDFLEFEKKRINDVKVWWTKFYKAKIGDKLDEVLYYVINAEFDSNLKTSVNRKGDYHLIQLSALKNSEQMSMLMILPRDKKIPKDYSLIRIIDSKKDVLMDFGPMYILNVEEYKEEDPSLVYLNLPSKPEKDIVYKFLKENLIKDDDYKAQSFQSPISSSPFTKNIGGGISLSSFSPIYSFSQEFLKTLKMIQPPEFTDIFYDYPKSILKGKIIANSIKGSSFKLGDFPSSSKNHFSCFTSPVYENLNLELKRKKMFNGEYSIACSLNENSDTASERLRGILSNFVKTDISNRMNLEDLKYTQDIDLFQIQREINEDLWVQIVNQRQNSPSINNFDESSFRKKLITDWKGIMESLNVKNPNVNEASIYANKSFDNIIRVAQSMARDNQMNYVDSKILDNSYKLFIRNSTELVLDVGVQRAVEGVKEEQKNKIKEVLQSTLTIKALTLNQLFEEVGQLFGGNLLKLQQTLDQLKREGMIYEPINGYYKWL